MIERNTWIIPIPKQLAETKFQPTVPIEQQLTPVENYIQKPLPEAFVNIEILASEIRKYENPVDLTVFYSKRKKLSEEQENLLVEHNENAYKAALEASGLIAYYQGEIQENDNVVDNEIELDFAPTCVSFCIWESLQKAKKVSAKPQHTTAAHLATTWYEEFAIKKFIVQVNDSLIEGYECLIFEQTDLVAN
ncbi:MAG TPA: hypothetical protein VLG12_08565 [Candidatus Saccharimonadales bacterium]|nr:hypothetical protein [Candidatus Saccharimonadales bacterium]